MSSFSSNVPTRPSVPGRRRWGLLIAGIIVTVIATLAIAGGAIAYGLAVMNSTTDPIAAARTPDTLTFVADARTYQITILSGFEDMASSVECSVERADGTTANVDGDVQASSVRIGDAQTVGSFTAVAGPTLVTCDASADDVQFQVAEESELEGLSITIMLIGGAVLLAGVVMILVGVFTRKRAV